MRKKVELELIIAMILIGICSSPPLLNLNTTNH